MNSVEPTMLRLSETLDLRSQSDSPTWGLPNLQRLWLSARRDRLGTVSVKFFPRRPDIADPFRSRVNRIRSIIDPPRRQATTSSHLRNKSPRCDTRYTEPSRLPLLTAIPSASLTDGFIAGL